MEAVVEELLRSDELSIRLRARTEIVGEPFNSPGVKALRAEVKRSARVRALLSERVGGALPHHPYAKWYGAHWILAALADLGYPKGDSSLAPMRAQVYDWLFSKEHLKYSRGHEPRAEPVTRSRGLVRAHASMEGNAVYYLNALGLADDRTTALADRLVEWQWPDGGWNCDKRKTAHTSSFTESLLPLRGLAFQSKVGRASYRDAIERAANYFLDRRLFRRRRDGRVISASFTKLHYPCYWHYDILFGLKVMKEAGFLGDERCSDAISLLKSKQLDDGGFPAEGAYYRVGRAGTSGRSLASWRSKGEKRMNEFVTCDALAVLHSLLR